MSIAENVSRAHATLMYRFIVVVAAALICLPCSALAAEDVSREAVDTPDAQALTDEPECDTSAMSSFDYICARLREGVYDTLAQVDKILPVNWELIGQIGNQARSGHGICCPGYACAYGDAILDGTVNSHTYYGCGSCIWRDWGGGNSSFCCVGTSQDLLREAYEQIRQGRPTVMHVRASYGQHWITLFGYQNVYDVEHLSLDNFLALDPWDASQLIASERFSLYGDGCEHISSR